VKKKAPFQLDCFGFLGILLLISGISSLVVAVYGILEVMK